MGRIALPRRQVAPRYRQPLQAKPNERGMRMGGETLNFIPGDTVIKPLRNMLLVEAQNVVRSRVLIVLDTSKPLKGIVVAAGPGTYPKQYDHPEKQKRTKMWDSKKFRPTEVKVGDEIEVGGEEIGGYSFETCVYGDRFCFWCTEDDVAAIHVPDAVDQGPADGPEALCGRDLQSAAAG